MVEKVSHIKILTKEERDFLNETYTFWTTDDLLIVKYKTKTTFTAHPLNKSYHLSAGVRKITLTPNAIKIWKDNFEKVSKYTLIDVQNAINLLRISYQNLSIDDIKSQLKIVEEKDKKDMFI